MNFADLGDSEWNKFCFSRLRQQLLYELCTCMCICLHFALSCLSCRTMLTPSCPYTHSLSPQTAVPMAAVPRGLTAVARLLSGCASALSVPHKCQVPSSGAGLQGVPPGYWGKATERSWAAGVATLLRGDGLLLEGRVPGVGSRPWGGSIICETPGLLQEM